MDSFSPVSPRYVSNIFSMDTPDAEKKTEEADTGRANASKWYHINRNFLAIKLVYFWQFAGEILKSGRMPLFRVTLARLRGNLDGSSHRLMHTSIDFL